jgi:hypothetical protein
MELDVSRIFSDRVVWDQANPEQLRVTNSLWDWFIRIISWIFSPESYTEENKKTIQCFKNYLIDTLGAERLQRISNRYSLDLNEMEEKGSPLLSRHVAQIVIGAKDVSLLDIPNHSELTNEELVQIYRDLSQKINPDWRVPELSKKIFHGGATEWFARLFYDPFLADRERQYLQETFSEKSFGVYVHTLAVKVAKREPEVGTIIPAPKNQFYYVSGKLVTGEGMVSYLFHPVGKDSTLEPIRIFRGTASRNGEVDSISSVITDFETELGKSAFESGEVYEQKIAEELGQPEIEAGHSLGSALVQYRLANHDHIKRAYLFCGPGIPLSEVEKFNQKNRETELIIRFAEGDTLRQSGDAHLGYQAPDKVKIKFRKYYPHPDHEHSYHVTLWPEAIHRYGIERQYNDADFYHKDSLKEKVRSTFGPMVAATLRGVRAVWRSCVTTRAETERGLTYLNRKLEVAHFRPMP